MRGSQFLVLPAEVRNAILRLVVYRENGIQVAQTAQSWNTDKEDRAYHARFSEDACEHIPLRNQHIEALLVSKQYLQEALELLYGTNRFQFEDPQTLFAFGLLGNNHLIRALRITCKSGCALQRACEELASFRGLHSLMLDVSLAALQATLSVDIAQREVFQEDIKENQFLQMLLRIRGLRVAEVQLIGCWSDQRAANPSLGLALNDTTSRNFSIFATLAAESILKPRELTRVHGHEQADVSSCSISTSRSTIVHIEHDAVDPIKDDRDLLAEAREGLQDNKRRTDDDDDDDDDGGDDDEDEDEDEDENVKLWIFSEIKAKHEKECWLDVV